MQWFCNDVHVYPTRYSVCITFSCSASTARPFVAVDVIGKLAYPKDLLAKVIGLLFLELVKNSRLASAYGRPQKNQKKFEISCCWLGLEKYLTQFCSKRRGGQQGRHTCTTRIPKKKQTSTNFLYIVSFSRNYDCHSASYTVTSDVVAQPHKFSSDWKG